MGARHHAPYSERAMNMMVAGGWDVQTDGADGRGGWRADGAVDDVGGGASGGPRE